MGQGISESECGGASKSVQGRISVSMLAVCDRRGHCQNVLKNVARRVWVCVSDRVNSRTTMCECLRSLLCVRGGLYSELLGVYLVTVWARENAPSSFKPGRGPCIPAHP